MNSEEEASEAERLAAVEKSALRHERWHTDIGKRMTSFEAKLEENCVDTKAIKTDTQGLVEFFTSVKGAFRVLEMLGKVAKPFAAIAAAFAAAVALWPKGLWPRS